MKFSNEKKYTKEKEIKEENGCIRFLVLKLRNMDIFIKNGRLPPLRKPYLSKLHQKKLCRGKLIAIKVFQDITFNFP